MLSLVVFMHRAVNIPRKKKRRRVLPQSLNFVTSTKCLFS